jgi:hypothetical protein
MDGFYAAKRPNHLSLVTNGKEVCGDSTANWKIWPKKKGGGGEVLPATTERE